MITIPSIEIRNGTCQVPGMTAGARVAMPERAPVSLARTWAADGFRRLQISDSGASCDRRPSTIIEEIVRDGAISVQAVVDTPSTDLVDRLADAGAERLVIPAGAVDDSDWIE